MNTRTWLGGAAALVVAGMMVACGGSSSPTAPDPGSGGSGSGSGAVGATLTIGSNGISPTSATISVGQSITLVNNDSKAHDISSNPHPVHTDCPALNMGTLNPGQSKTSNAFNTARTCGYHDHLDPNNANWQGQVTVR
jgi:plastocyanin